MYLNLTLIHDKGYTLPEVICMQVLRQNRTEDNENYLSMYLNEEIMDKFERMSLITFVKKKRKSDSDFSIMRLSKSGEALLEDFETPEVTTGDLEMFDFLCDMYLDNEDKDRIIGNKKKTKMYCVIFRNRMNLSLHEMFWLCRLFLEKYKFTKKLEYIFFDSNKNRYGKFENSLEDSPLYQFLDERRAEVEALWAKKIENYQR